MATILRSSKYVRSFAELANKLAVSKCTCDVRVSISQVQKCAPSTLARSLATQVVAQTLDNESSLEYNLQKLDSDVKKTGRISRTRMERIFTEFRESDSVTSTQALMILRCCGSLINDELPQSRSELVNEIWKSFENSGIQLDIAHYNALLRVYIENDYAFSPAEILADLERKGIEPNKLTYQRLITRYCTQGDIDGASKVLEYMKEKGISLNENIFNALVKGHGVANDMTSAADILLVMQQAGLQPSADTYKELLCGYAKHGDMESITNTLSECRSNNVQLLDTDYLDIISSLASNGHIKHIETILSMMPKDFGYLQESLNYIVKLVQAGHIDAAKLVLSSIPSCQNSRLGTAAIRQLAKCNLPVETLVDTCKEIQAKGINSDALMTALGITLTKGDAEASLALIKALHESGKEIREHYFWPILVALGRSKNNSAVHDILRTMQSMLNEPISGETLRDYVLVYETNDPEVIMADLSTSGLPFTTLAISITYHLIMQSKLKEAAAFAQKYDFRFKSSLFTRPLSMALAQTRDVKSYVSILHHVFRNRFDMITESGQKISIHNEILEPFLYDAINLLKNNKVAILSEVFTEMSETGLQISDATFKALEKAIGREMTPNLHGLLYKLKHSRSAYTPASEANRRAEISQLEGSLSEPTSSENLIAKKKRLLFLYSWTEDLPNLERMERELKEQGVPFTAVMYKQLMYGYLGSNSIEKVEEYLKCMRLTNPDFTLDNSKLIKYVTSLVDNGRIEDAVKFLQEQSVIKTEQPRPRGIHEKMLNALAELGNPEAVTAVFNMFLKNDYIFISNPFLRPLIKVHVERGDLETALNVFGTLCEKYHLTPYKNELAKKFIETEDATSLQRLTDFSTHIHGESNSLYDLAQSFIEANCLRQARKILEIPALHGNINRLKLSSKRFRDQGQTVSSERLVAVIIEVPHLKELPEFYNDLLSCYVRENNWEKGLNLWKQMLDEDIEPSNIFLVNLAELLKRNKQRIPYTVPGLSENEKQEVGLPLGKESSLRMKNNDEHVESTSETANRQPKDTEIIGQLLRDNKMDEVYRMVENMLDNYNYSQFRKFRSVLRYLARAGKTELLEQLSTKMSVTARKTLGIDFEICMAYIESGKPEAYLDMVEKHYETEDIDEFNKVVGNFRASGLRLIFRKHPELIERYTKVAEDCAAKGSLQPFNVLWVHYFVEGNPAADKIWSEHMINYPQLRYHSILRSAQDRGNSGLIEALLEKLETSPVVDNPSKGYIYSELVKLHLKNDKFEQSIDALRKALTTLSVEDLQPTLLTKLHAYLKRKGQKLPNDIVEKIATTDVTPDKVQPTT